MYVIFLYWSEGYTVEFTGRFNLVNNEKSFAFQILDSPYLVEVYFRLCFKRPGVLCNMQILVSELREDDHVLKSKKNK